MRRAGPALPLAAAALLVGCREPLRDAALRPVCAPHDAPAVGLVVSYERADYPQLRFRFAGPVGSLAVRRIAIHGSGDAAAFAQWCRSEGECGPPRETRLAFGTLSYDSVMLVSLRSTLATGDSIKTLVRGRWHGETLVCG